MGRNDSLGGGRTECLAAWDSIEITHFVCTLNGGRDLIQPLKDFFEIISATLIMLENICELQCYPEIDSEIISGKFPRAEIKLFQTDVDEG